MIRKLFDLPPCPTSEWMVGSVWACGSHRVRIGLQADPPNHHAMATLSLWTKDGWQDVCHEYMGQKPTDYPHGYGRWLRDQSPRFRAEIEPRMVELAVMFLDGFDDSGPA